MPRKRVRGRVSEHGFPEYSEELLQGEGLTHTILALGTKCRCGEFSRGDVGLGVK